MGWHPWCCCAICTHCLNDVAPGQFLVGLSGIVVKGTPECADCASLDGSYVAEKIPAIMPWAPGCLWEHILETPYCGATRIVVYIDAWFFPTYKVWVVLVDDNYDTLALATKVYVGKPDCQAFDGETMGAPWENPSLPLGCEVSGATFTVTAIKPCEE